jgi:hypothetical protein
VTLGGWQIGLLRLGPSEGNLDGGRMELILPV